MLGLLVLDSIFRRLVLPLSLLTAIVFRYNLVSLAYLALLLLSFLLPSTRNSRQCGFSLIHETLVVAVSLIVTLGQAGFQLILLTDYKNDFAPCNSTESAWREIGFILYQGVPAEDIVRYLSLDFGVFLISLFSLIISIYVVHNLRKQSRTGMQEFSSLTSTSELNPVPSPDQDINITKATTFNSEVRSSTRYGSIDAAKPETEPRPLAPTPTAHAFLKIPSSLLFLLDLALVLFLVLSICSYVSISSVVYLSVFFAFSLLWSIHQTAVPLKIFLRAVIVLFSCLHLFAIYLYQLNYAQEVLPMEPRNTATSKGLRLAGIPMLITLNCTRSTQLLLPDNVLYSYYLNPLFILLVFVTAALDLRLRLFKPRMPHSCKGVVFIPSYTPRFWAYPAKSHPIRKSPTPAHVVDETSDTRITIPLLRHPQGKSSDRSEQVSKSKWVHRILELIRQIGFAISFAIALVSMMAWSIVFPSWLSLVLLLWALIIWLLPLLSPKRALLYTSPLLVLYSCCLLTLQLLPHLNLDKAEQPGDLQEMIKLRFVYQEPNPRLHFPFLILQFVFTLFFFVALYTLISDVKRRRRQVTSASEQATVEDPFQSAQERQPISGATVSGLREDLLVYVSNYWVILSAAAFLIAALVGEPSFFKMVYMAGFIISLLIYQVFRTLWYKICIPLWWGMVLYSVCELTIVYIYQFQPVSEALLNSINFTEKMALVESIGFPPVAIEDVYTVRELLQILLPPTFFIVVMVTQLRYFGPKSSDVERANLSKLTGSATKLLKSAGKQVSDTYITARKRKPGMEKSGSGSEKSGRGITKGKSFEQSDGSSPEATGEVETSSEDDREVQKPGKCKGCLQRSGEGCRLVAKWAWRLIVQVNQLFWQFCEIHLHKIISLVMFSIILRQPGLMLLMFLVILIVSMPYRRPRFNFVFYPIFTLLLGALVLLEMCYQVRIISPGDFRLANCSEWMNNTYKYESNGVRLSYEFSPHQNDAAWFGLYKTAYFFSLIVGHVSLLILISFWFTVKRRQERYRQRLFVESTTLVPKKESGSLFPLLTRSDAETSVWRALQYLINHFFDYFGLQVCCAMLAIVMATRNDIYTFIYGIILVICIIISYLPKMAVTVVWPVVTYLVGLLIALQYGFLLGVPPGACFQPYRDRDYPWTQQSVQFKKWFFLSDYISILNRDALYVDFILFLLMALKTFRIFNEAQGTSIKTTDKAQDGSWRQYWSSREFLLTLRDFLFGNWIWVCLLLLFLAGAVKVSILGYLYIFICFGMSYWGRGMLAATPRKLLISWESIRMFTLMLMIIRSILQILGCVYHDPTNESKCLTLLVFNAYCVRQDYYFRPGSIASCANSPNIPATGLAYDAALFIVLTIQILILKSTAFSHVQSQYRKKLQKAQYGAICFDELVKERLETKIYQRKTEEEEINAKVKLLELHQGKLITHKLHAGTIIPKDVKFLKNKTTSQTSSAAMTPLVAPPKVFPPLTEAVPQSTVERKGVTDSIREFLRETYHLAVGWLEKQSEIYTKVQRKLESVNPKGEEEEESVTSEKPTGRKYISLPVDEEERLTSASSPEESEPVEVRKPPQSSSATEDGDPAKLQLRTDDKIQEARIVQHQDHLKKSVSVESLIEEKAENYSFLIWRVVLAIYYFLVSNTAYLCYFFIIMNVIFNGSVLSLVYVALLFFWGLLTIPYPTKRFWLVMIAYTMVVIVIKYGFQFKEIDNIINPLRGLPILQVIGIQFKEDFIENVIWDILLLLSLVLHRAVLKESGLWRKSSLKYVITKVLKGGSPPRESPQDDGAEDGDEADSEDEEEEYVVVSLEEEFKDIEEFAAEETVSVFEKIKGIFSRAFKEFYKFYKKAISPEITFGARDYYVSLVVLDVICLVIIVLGFQSFGLGQGEFQQVASFIQNNDVPLPFLIFLLLQFLSIVIDRGIYLRKSVPAKLIFTILLILCWHAYIFFALPAYTGTPFLENYAAQAIYFFKGWYFVLSAFQIISGYPYRILGYVWGKTPSYISGLVLQGYRLIPIIPILREAMDWFLTPTSLRLKHWLTVQEIWAQLFLIKVQRKWEKGSPRKLGTPPSSLVKLLMGGGLAVFFIALIWGPLIVLSVLNTTNVPNPPTDFSITLGFSGFQPLFTMKAQRRFLEQSITEEMYNELIEKYKSDGQLDLAEQLQREVFYKRTQFSRILMQGDGNSLWITSPPARQQLEDTLCQKNVTVSLAFSWSITRSPPSGLVAETIDGSHNIELDNNTSCNLYNVLNASSGNVTIKDLFPKIMYAPGNGQSSNYTTLNVLSPASITCQLIFEDTSTSTNGKSWWSLKQETGRVFSELPRNLQSENPLEFILFSELVQRGEFSVLFTGSLGIIGLYTIVVLGIAKIFQSWTSNLLYQLSFEEIPNPDHLLQLCGDVFTAREAGKLALEEILAGNIIYIFRSNTKLLEWTKLKQE